MLLMLLAVNDLLIKLVHAIVDDALYYLKARGLEGLHRTTELFTLISEDGLHAPNHKIHHLSNGSKDNISRLFIWSAGDSAGLSRLNEAYLQYFQKQTRESYTKRLIDIAYTLSEKRARLPWKSFAIAKSIGDLLQGLAEGFPEAIRSANLRNLGFIFTGQGIRTID